MMALRRWAVDLAGGADEEEGEERKRTKGDPRETHFLFRLPGLSLPFDAGMKSPSSALDMMPPTLSSLLFLVEV